MTCGWLRSDITAHRADPASLPKRRDDELRAQYFDSPELVALLSLSTTSVLAGEPVAPGDRASRRSLYWLKADADDWIAKNRDQIDRRSARRQSRSAARPDVVTS